MFAKSPPPVDGQTNRELPWGNHEPFIDFFLFPDITSDMVMGCIMIAIFCVHKDLDEIKPFLTGKKGLYIMQTRIQSTRSCCCILSDDGLNLLASMRDHSIHILFFLLLSQGGRGGLNVSTKLEVFCLYIFYF